MTCDLAFFRKCHVPDLNGQRDDEHPGSLGCAVELGTMFAFASDSSMRKISPIAGWASMCLLRRSYLNLEGIPCKNIEICYPRWAEQSLWRGCILHQLQTNSQYFQGTVVQTSWEPYVECFWSVTYVGYDCHKYRLKIYKQTLCCVFHFQETPLI